MGVNIIIAVLVGMILCHLIADYTLQGWLAQAKQKSYWAKYDKKYRNDWIPALICHSTMWAICIMIPMAIASKMELNYVWIALPVNIGLHFLIDHLKANKLSINLICDQICHLIQIIGTWGLWAVACCNNPLFGAIASYTNLGIAALTFIITIIVTCVEKVNKKE